MAVGDYTYAGETFPTADNLHFRPLFEAHGREVRERTMDLHWKRYQDMRHAGRYVWIVAREKTNERRPVGYSGHYWYFDLHFASDKVAADDLWYVRPLHRGQGVGRRLREMGLAALKSMGCTATHDLIRIGGPDLTKYGYEPWGTRWIKRL